MIGIGVDTTGLDAAAGRRAGAAAGARSALARQPRGARVAVEGPHRRGRGGGDHRDGARARAGVLAPIGGTYSSEWWWSKIWHCLKVAPDVFDAAASWVELADFIPARARRRRRPARNRALRLRRRPQGDVLARPGAACRRRRSSRGSIRSSPICAIGLYDKALPPGTPAGHALPRVGDGARPAARASRSRWAASTRTTAPSAPASRTGTLVKIIGTSTCDCAIAPVVRTTIADDPRHLRHRQRLDHAGLLRHRSGAVGGRRHPELVGRRRVRGRRRAARAAVGARRRRCAPGESGLSRSTGTTATARSWSTRG